jgi:hypothetical protein
MSGQIPKAGREVFYEVFLKDSIMICKVCHPDLEEIDEVTIVAFGLTYEFAGMHAEDTGHDDWTVVTKADKTRTYDDWTVTNPQS